MTEPSIPVPAVRRAYYTIAQASAAFGIAEAELRFAVRVGRLSWYCAPDTGLLCIPSEQFARYAVETTGLEIADELGGQVASRPSLSRRANRALPAGWRLIK